MSTYHESMQEMVEREFEPNLQDCFYFQPSNGKWRDTDGAFFHVWFARQKDLSHCERLVLMVVFQFVRTCDSHTWFGSVEEMCDYIGYCKDSVKKAFQNLCKTDYLIAKPCRGDKKKYQYRLGDRMVEFASEVQNKGFMFAVGDNHIPITKHS